MILLWVFFEPGLKLGITIVFCNDCDSNIEMPNHDSDKWHKYANIYGEFLK
ncbi:hypothetical protein V6Z11_D11G189300 [Gossypium hirsutum]